MKKARRGIVFVLLVVGIVLGGKLSFGTFSPGTGTSSEFGVASPSPLGEGGGFSLPASCESNYIHDATDCVVAFSANPPSVTRNVGSTTLSWNFVQYGPREGTALNSTGTFWSQYYSPYFCTITGPGVNQTFWYPNSVAGAVTTPILSVDSTYTATCRSALGIGIYYPNPPAEYYDFTSSKTVLALDPPGISGFVTNPVKPYAGQDFELRWYVNSAIVGCTAVSVSPTNAQIGNLWPTDPGNYNGPYGTTVSGSSIGVFATQITSGPDTGTSLRRASRHIRIDTAGTYDFVTTCTNGSVSTPQRTDTVVVNPTPAVTVDSFTANPSVVDAGGLTALTWGTSYAQQCFEGGDSVYISQPGFLTPASTGDVAAIGFFKSNRLPVTNAVNKSVSGSVRVVPINSPTTFVLGCYDYATNAVANSATRGLNNVTGTYVAPVKKSVFVDVKGISLSASPKSLAGAGNTTLTWTISAAREQSCAATSNPSVPAWNNAALPIANGGPLSVSVTGTTDFTITCQKTAAAGGGSESVTTTVNVGLPRIDNFSFAPNPTAIIYGKKPYAVTYKPSSLTNQIRVKLVEINKWAPNGGSTLVDGATAVSSAPSWPTVDSGAPAGSTIYMSILGIDYWTTVPAPTQKTTYTVVMTPYDTVNFGWTPGTSAQTTVDVYPANPVTVREAKSLNSGYTNGSVKTLPGGDPTQNITLGVTAYENSSAPYTASFKFDAGPNAKECYITRNNILVSTISAPAPEGNVYTPTAFLPPPDAVTAQDPASLQSRFAVTCYYNDGTLISSTNNVIFTIPPYATGVSASCVLNGTTPNLTFSYTVPSGATSAAVSAHTVPGAWQSACAPTTTPQTTPGGSLCEYPATVGTGAKTYTLPNNTPILWPLIMAAPTHAAALPGKKYNYWVQTVDADGNWGDVSPYAATVDISHRVQCPDVPNQIPVAVIDSPAVSFTKNTTDQITFTGHATDPDSGDTIVRYYWAYGSTVLFDSATTNTTVNPGNFPGVTFTKTLPVGTYTAGDYATGIRFVALDSKGEWSAPVYVPTLTVSLLPISVNLTATPVTASLQDVKKANLAQVPNIITNGPMSANPGSSVDLTWTISGTPPTSCVSSIESPLDALSAPLDTTSAWITPITNRSVNGGTQRVVAPNYGETYKLTCTDGTQIGIGRVILTTNFKKGDGKCEGNKGENVVNSPLDCKNGQFHEQIQ